VGGDLSSCYYDRHNPLGIVFDSVSNQVRSPVGGDDFTEPFETSRDTKVSNQVRSPVGGDPYYPLWRDSFPPLLCFQSGEIPCGWGLATMSIIGRVPTGVSNQVRSPVGGD
jgi:hypothetical protein